MWISILISREKNFLYFHIPKTAGNSVVFSLHSFSETNLVEDASPEPDLQMNNFWLHDKKMGLHKHLSAADYCNVYGRENIEPLFRFSCIRNPWDRLISVYFFWKAIGYIKSEKPNEFDPGEFEEMLKSPYARTPYMRFLSVENKLFVDFLMRFESLDDDFARVCEVLGLSGVVLPHKNKSHHAHYKSYYDTRLKDIVAELHAEDISVFKYSF